MRYIALAAMLACAGCTAIPIPRPVELHTTPDMDGRTCMHHVTYSRMHLGLVERLSVRIESSCSAGGRGIHLIAQ